MEHSWSFQLKVFIGHCGKLAKTLIPARRGGGVPFGHARGRTAGVERLLDHGFAGSVEPWRCKGRT